MKKFNLELSSPLPVGEHKAKALGNNVYVTLPSTSVKKICTRYISDKVVEGCLIVNANGMKATFMIGKKVIFEATLPEVVVEAKRIEPKKEVKVEEVKVEEVKEEPKEIEPVVDFVAEPKEEEVKEEPKPKARKPRRKTTKKKETKKEEPKKDEE